MNGITMTKENSLVSVIYDGNILVLDFPFDRNIIELVKKVDGAEWDKTVEKKWTVPRSSYKSLTSIFGNKIIWKNQNELKQTATELTFKEESLDDVLNRIPNNIQTPFMKLEPHDFQKLMVAWGITKKGKKGDIYGGLLGDLMGLGKTIQALAFSGYLKHNTIPDIGEIKRVLIICPATIKIQWGQEIEKFTNERYVMIDGGKGKNAWKKRVEQYEMAKSDDIMYTIVNYELLIQKERLGKEEVKEGWKKVTKIIQGDFIDLNCILENNYDMIIIDEAQRMKNPDAKTFQAINKIQTPKVRLLMTGTPIEKDIQNIFPLMDYLSPNILADERYDFETRRKMFTDKYLIMGWDEHALRASRGRAKIPKIKGVKNIGLLKRAIAPYTLRRTTDDISDEMPDAPENNIVVDWDKEQRALYEHIQDALFKAHEEMAEAISSEKEDERIKAENEMNAMLMYMLEVCDTPELLLMSESTLAQRKLKEVKPFKNYLEKLKKIETSKISSQEKEKSKNKIKPAWMSPPKLERLVEMVNDITVENDQKVVIFSKFERMTQILQREIHKKINLNSKGSIKKDPIRITMYTGNTDKGCMWKTKLDKAEEPSDNLNCNECPFSTRCNSRTKSAWYFQNDPKTKVIIASDAGKYGVNLQAAKYLINYDLPDTFSTYDQRKGRIRRLNSSHDTVHIYNMITAEGIDEKKYYKLMEQKDIIDQVIEKNDSEENAVVRATASMNKSLLNEVVKRKKRKK
jgi:SNF2 family DNA or RNA helicase